MTPFEEQLKKALARREPAADFTARVLARCGEEAESSPRNRFSKWLAAMRSWQLIAVTAAGIVVVTGSTAYQQHEREVRGEAAKRKLLLAMRIAGSKLQEAQQRVVEMESTEVQQ